MTNMTLAEKTLQALKEWGVQDICLCPGGRNAPFVFLLADSPSFRVHSAFDERTAAFYTLGLSQSQQRPAAIITTSGTAVAEVLPAVIEAHYTRTPLIVISADRPPRMRGTGAPQTIEQANLFSGYVETAVDISSDWPAEISWQQNSPLHLNICFDEPLLDAEVKPFKASTETFKTFPKKENPELKDVLAGFLKDKKNPLLLISTLNRAESEAVQVFASQWPGLIYAESTSGAREMSFDGMIVSGDRFPRELVKNKKVDGVLRLGGVPTARVWRDIEGTKFPVLSLSSAPFSGLSQGGLCQGPLEPLPTLMDILNPFHVPAEILDRDLALYQKQNELLQEFPKSEPALVRWLSEDLKPSTTMYVGNSLPIREWDLVAQRKHPLHVKANRGANGIDGQIATALGHRREDRDLCVLVGDLTAMYDSNSLWFLKNHNLSPNSSQVLVCVLNNRGGKIFQRMFNHPLFYNQHSLNFKAWAESWNCDYTLATKPMELPETSSVVEIVPDLEQTEQFWKKFDAIWADT